MCWDSPRALQTQCTMVVSEDASMPAYESSSLSCGHFHVERIVLFLVRSPNISVSPLDFETVPYLERATDTQSRNQPESDSVSMRPPDTRGGVLTAFILAACVDSSFGFLASGSFLGLSLKQQCSVAAFQGCSPSLMGLNRGPALMMSGGPSGRTGESMGDVLRRATEAEMSYEQSLSASQDLDNADIDELSAQGNDASVDVRSASISEEDIAEDFFFTAPIEPSSSFSTPPLQTPVSTRAPYASTSSQTPIASTTSSLPSPGRISSVESASTSRLLEIADFGINSMFNSPVYIGSEDLHFAVPMPNEVISPTLSLSASLTLDLLPSLPQSLPLLYLFLPRPFSPFFTFFASVASSLKPFLNLEGSTDCVDLLIFL